jgi:hypothetical protein
LSTWVCTVSLDWLLGDMMLDLSVGGVGDAIMEPALSVPLSPR